MTIDPETRPLVTAAIGAAGAVIGAAVAWLSVVINNRENTKRLRMQFDFEGERRNAELLRDRGEELYVSAKKWVDGLLDRYLALSGVMKGEITYDEHRDLLAEEKTPVEIARIELLIHCYLPSVRASFEAVLAVNEKLASVTYAHRREYEESAAGLHESQYLMPFTEALTGLHEASQAFQAEILQTLVKQSRPRDEA